MTTSETIENLKRDLRAIRSQSLDATRQGDFMKVARLTAQAAGINRLIMDAEGRAEAAKYGAPQKHAAKML